MVSWLKSCVPKKVKPFSVFQLQFESQTVWANGYVQPRNEFNRPLAYSCGWCVCLWYPNHTILREFLHFCGSPEFSHQYSILMKQIHKHVIKLAKNINDNCTIQRGHIWHMVERQNALDMAIIWQMFFQTSFRSQTTKNWFHIIQWNPCCLLNWHAFSDVTSKNETSTTWCKKYDRTINQLVISKYQRCSFFCF